MFLRHSTIHANTGVGKLRYGGPYAAHYAFLTRRVELEEMILFSGAFPDTYLLLFILIGIKAHFLPIP